MFHAIYLSKSDPTPLYIQLASELAKYIQDNTFDVGTKLPTIRSLSNQLGINRDTVVSAYKLLENQGLVESHIGKGTYISVIPTSISSKAPIEYAHKICCSQVSLPKAYFPEKLCLNLTSEIIKSENWESFIDPFFRERQLLKESVSEFIRNLSIPHHYAQVRVIKTMEQFLLDLFKVSPKTGICVEATRDLSWSCQLRSLGAKIYEIPLTDSGMDLEILEKHLHSGNISYIFISSFLQNPTGLCYSAQCRKKIISLATEYNATIVDDITYVSFLNPVPKFILKSDDPIIYIHQFSKLYLPYMNYTFAILPTSYTRRLRDTIECSFNERFLRHYLCSSELKNIITCTKKTFSSNYNFLSNELSKLPLKISNQNGGISFWIRVPVKKYETLCKHLLANDIIISPGELFSTTPCKGHFRLSITHLSTDDIDYIISKLKYFFDETSK